MKSNHKAFLIAFAAIVVIGLVGYLVFILPESSSASENHKSIQKKEKDLKNLGTDNDMEYVKIKELYADRNTELFSLQNSLITTLGFLLTDRYDVTRIVQPESDFPILRNDIVARIQESYPGFPFDVKFGFPDLIKGDLEVFRDKYIRLAICERLLQIFGEASIDIVLDFEHPGEITTTEPDSKMTIIRKIVSVRAEGKMESILAALKMMSTPGKYLRIEKLAIHSSRSGYAHGCDLQVSIIIIQLENTGETPVVTPPADTNQPPLPSVAPSPAPSGIAPSSTTDSPAPKTSRPPFGF